jgi:hypothetical protein
MPSGKADYQMLFRMIHNGKQRVDLHAKHWEKRR